MKNNKIKKIETNGTFVTEFPVDESMNNPNAGDAQVYIVKENNPKRFAVYEVITWNSSAIDHKEGDKTVSEIYSFDLPKMDIFQEDEYLDEIINIVLEGRTAEDFE